MALKPHQEKSHVDFIIGVDEEGNEITHTLSTRLVSTGVLR